MCALEDLINSSYGSADNMTNTLKDYGENSMGNGIRKATNESYDQGYNDCLETEVPKAYDEGRKVGYQECRETEVPKAHDEGVIEGAIATVIIGAALFGIYKAVGFVKAKISDYKAHKNSKRKSDKSDDESDTPNTNN